MDSGWCKVCDKRFMDELARAQRAIEKLDAKRKIRDRFPDRYNKIKEMAIAVRHPEGDIVVYLDVALLCSSTHEFATLNPYTGEWFQNRCGSFWVPDSLKRRSQLEYEAYIAANVEETLSKMEQVSSSVSLGAK